MKIGTHLKSVLTGSLLILSIAVAAALFKWVTTYPLSSDGRLSGQQYLILSFVPPAAAVGLYYLVHALRQIWIGLTRYTLDANGVTVRSPLRTHFASWTSVRDFLLPPAPFPKPPQSIVLLLADGRQLELPLSRFREAHSDNLLTASIPNLHDWGLDRARPAEPTTLSTLRTRWQLYKSDLFALYGSTIFFLLCALGLLMTTWEFVSYLRILHSHASTTAVITQITEEEGKNKIVRATVAYTIPNGRTIHLHHEVRVDFIDRFKVGHHVTVDYLPSNPSIARIRDWDMDGRQWGLALFTLIMLPFIYVATKRELAKWFRPLREQLVWCASPASLPIAISGIDLPLLYAILPDRHAGTIIVKPSQMGSDKKPGFKVWARRLKKQGIQVTTERGKFIVLSPPEASRMLQRLGGPNPPSAPYIVLETPSATNADFSLLAELASPVL